MDADPKPRPRRPPPPAVPPKPQSLRTAVCQSRGLGAPALPHSGSPTMSVVVIETCNSSIPNGDCTSTSDQGAIIESQDASVAVHFSENKGEDAEGSKSVDLPNGSG